MIGTLDNIVRAYVLQSDTKLHPLLAFVSVLGGLQVMGLWEVFIGSVFACCLHVLIEISNEDVQEMPLDSVIPAIPGSTVDPSLSQTVSTKPEVSEPAVKEKTVNTPASVKAADETNPKSPTGSESAGEEKSDE